MSISLKHTGVDHKKIQSGGGDVQCDFWDPLQVGPAQNDPKQLLLNLDLFFSHAEQL